MGVRGTVGSRQRGGNRPFDGRERGATALEYAALIVVAALILGALWASFTLTDLEGKVRVAICQILMPGADCSAAGGDDGEDEEKPNFLPVYCDALINSESQNLTAKIAWFSFGENFTLMKEKLANGEVWITVVPHDYKAGADFKVGENVDVGGDVHMSMGDTYQFQGDDDADQWMETLRNNVKEHNPTTGRFWNPFDGGEQPMKKPVIDSTTVGLGGTAEASAKLPGKVMDVGPHVKGSFSADVIHEKWHLWDPKRNRYWDNTSNTFKMSGEAEYGLGGKTNGKVPGSGKAGLDRKVKWTAAIRYMYNPDGTLANIRWITTYENGNKETGKYGTGKLPGGSDGPHVGGTHEESNETTRMDQVNFDNPNDYKDPLKKEKAQQQQQTGHDYIHKYGGVPPIPILNAIKGEPQGVTEDPGPDADPMTRMMFDKGKSWQWDSENTTNSTESGTPLRDMQNAPALEMSSSYTTKSTTDAKYLGAPKNGHRDYQDFPACEAATVPKNHDTRLDGY